MADVDGSAFSPGHVYLRSRRGCETCRTKKVKCDEQRSVCGRCRRLRLQCDWNSQITAKERKRLQKMNAVPKKILPRSPQGSQPPKEHPRVEQSSVNECFGYLGADDASAWCPYDATSYAVIEGCKAFPDDLWSLDLGINDHFYPLLLDPVPTAPVVPGCQSQCLDVKSPSADTRPSEPSHPLNILRPDLSTQRIALAPSFQVTKREHRALHHFQTQFSLSRSSKCPLWSTHALMLRLGWEQPMTMHLIIASSLTDLSLRSLENEALYRFAIPHFRAGLHLLIDTMNSGCASDQTTILPAFFFVYVYLGMRQDTPAQGVSQLSKMVLNYVRHYNLDGRSSGEYQTDNSTPSNHGAFTFRMLIWLFYEDAAGCFLGQGGMLARYLLSDPNHLEEIYEQSTTSLEACWGPYYPDSEAVDDVENATVLRSLFELMSLFQNINQLCESFTFDKNELIRKKVDALEEVCLSILTCVEIGPLTSEEITCFIPPH